MPTKLNSPAATWTELKSKKHFNKKKINLRKCYLQISLSTSDVFAVVTTDGDNQYRLSVFSDEAVPLFGPGLPCPPVFSDPYLFREFLLVKLINGEKATFETPTFARKRQRTLDMLIKDLYSEHMTDARMTMLNRRAFSDVLAETPRHSRLKEDSRQIEFVRIGQALKLEAIVRGDAPTSLASAGSPGTVFKRSPWEANCFYPVFPSQSIVCADSWGENKLIIGTEEGVWEFPPYDIRQKPASATAKRGRTPWNSAAPGRTLQQGRFLSYIGTNLKNNVIFIGGARLRMCVAIGRKLLMFQWKHSAAWTAWCPSSDTDTVDGFTFLWELNLNETPTMMTILDSGWSPNSPSQGDVLVCVGYKNHWDIVNGRTGYAQHLHTVESTKAHLVTALDLYEDQEIQLLLCYNLCAFPYVIAFTTNSMEIRLIVNGNLIHTMTMPKLQLIASKNDIFFATTAPEFFPNKTDRLFVDVRQQDLQKHSPPSSPNASPEIRPLRIYRIPIHALSRTVNSEHSCVSSGSPPTWKSADSKLTVPEQPRVSRSATSSPVPPKGKLSGAIK
ncbi:hypothetical protein NQ314_001693 [Rhamnusium bicolor]|uniref:Rap-GAP domain-containing protein n=1 Tax=Rhamnusium bicolor TaxID=1586634 RepID=A0AAV8ZUS3_9CUCU|nr:hypothetical protein NQ314_001693 [Rhamnusium bicolor]